MQTGITQCAIWNSQTTDFIAQAGKAGYDVVELMVKNDGELTPKTDDAGLEKIKKAAGAAKVKIFSLALLHLTAAPIDSGAAQETAIQEIEAGLQIAKKLGAGHVLLTMGRLRPDLYYEDAYKNGVAAMKKVGAIADKLGVDVAIEFVWTGFLFSPVEMKRFLDEVGHKRIGFYFDPGNMAVFQYPQHWVRALGKHTKLVHLKDWKGNALSGNWTGLLEGAVDFPAVMKELKAIGYQGPLTSEVDPQLASLEKTVDAIKKIATLA